MKIKKNTKADVIKFIYTVEDEMPHCLFCEHSFYEHCPNEFCNKCGQNYAWANYLRVDEIPLTKYLKAIENMEEEED